MSQILIDEAIKEFRATCVAEAVRLSFDQSLDGAEARAKMDDAEAKLRAALSAESQESGDIGGYVIRHGGAFYRPDAQGYTYSIHEAGRWSKEEAERHINDDPLHRVTVHPASMFLVAAPTPYQESRFHNPPDDGFDGDRGREANDYPYGEEPSNG